MKVENNKHPFIFVGNCGIFFCDLKTFNLFLAIFFLQKIGNFVTEYSILEL